MLTFLIYAVLSYYVIQRVRPLSFIKEGHLMSIPERVFVAITWLPLLLLALVYSLVVHVYKIVTHSKDF